MEKKIQDYLHLYLGCECQIIGVQGTFLFEGIEGDAVFVYNTDGTGRSVVAAGMVKPILRALIDMKEEEALSILKIIFNHEIIEHEFTYQPYDASHFEDAVECVFIDFKSNWNDKVNRCQLRIYNQFSYYLGWLQPTGNSNITAIKNQHEVTRFMLSKHFDLFGLIEAGLAIDKTTLK